MTKTLLTLRYHWKAVVVWSGLGVLAVGYAVWIGLADRVQAQMADEPKPSMVACAVIAVEMSKTKCVRITAPTAAYAVATCADYEEVDWEYDYDLGQYVEVITPVDCGCERVNACLSAVEEYGWSNLGVFENFIPRETPQTR